MTRATSAETYDQIKQQGLLSPRRWDVYNALYNHPGSTTAELQRHLPGMEKNDISPRLTELRKMGMIEEAGERECTVTGNTVITWITTDNLPGNLNKHYYCTWTVLHVGGSWQFHSVQTQAASPSAAWQKTRKEAIELSDIGAVVPAFLREHDGTNWFLIESRASTLSIEVAETFLASNSP